MAEVNQAGLSCLTGETREITDECVKRNLECTVLLKEKLAPLQKKVQAHSGQIISVVERGYDFNNFYMENLFVGVLTDKTYFFPWMEEGNSAKWNSFLTGIKNPYLIKTDYSCFEDAGFRDGLLDSEKERGIGDFRVQSGCLTVYPLLYFAERPPVFEEPEHQGEYILPVFPHNRKEPRLQFYIGNVKAIPMLQNSLTGYHYQELGDLLERELPLTPKVIKKIEEEQMEVYQKLVSAEKRLSLIREKIARQDQLDKDEIVINYGTHLELPVEACFTKLPEDFKKARNQLSWALKVSKTRKYSERGRVITLSPDIGVTYILDMKQFFADRIARYSANANVAV